MLLAIRHVQSTRKLVRTHKTRSYYLAWFYEGDEKVALLIAKFITELIELERIVSCSSLLKMKEVIENTPKIWWKIKPLSRKITSLWKLLMKLFIDIKDLLNFIRKSLTDILKVIWKSTSKNQVMKSTKFHNFRFIKFAQELSSQFPSETMTKDDKVSIKIIQKHSDGAKQPQIKTYQNMQK